MNLFREIILDSEPEPRSADWPLIVDVLLIVVWFCCVVWVLST